MSTKKVARRKVSKIKKRAKKIKKKTKRVTKKKMTIDVVVRKRNKIKKEFNGKKHGMVYIYTGTGAGKTTNALGIAMRCVGHKEKVVIIQFLKWWKETGEYKIRNKLKPYYEIYQFGRKGWIGLKNLDERDKELAQKGFELAKKIVKKKKPRVIVLDEINLALHCGLLDKREVIDFLLELPPETDAVLTGRYAPEELWDVADFVNIIVDAKHPKRLVAAKGVQY